MRKQLGQMLIEAGAIDDSALRSALNDQRRWGRPLGRTLVELRLIKEEDLVGVLAQQLGLPTVDLDRIAVSKIVLELVPSDLAHQHALMPFAVSGKFLDVAMSDPLNLGVIDELRIRTQLNIRPYLAGPRMIERALTKYYAATHNFEIRIGPSRGKPPTIDEPIAIDDGGRGSRDRIDSSPAPHAVVESLGSSPVPVPPAPRPAPSRDKEIDVLQLRISKLEALVERDEQVLRKLLALLIEKGLATRDEIVERLS